MFTVPTAMLDRVEQLRFINSWANSNTLTKNGKIYYCAHNGLHVL